MKHLDRGSNVSEQFFNRELSLLEFNRRVLYQAYDKDLPLLERLRFLCIFSTNQDEFFEVRVGGLVQMLEVGTSAIPPDGLTHGENLSAIGDICHQLVDEQYALFNEEILPLLNQHGMRLLRRDEWTDEQKTYLREYFETEILPLLSPIGLDPAHPFPRIMNKSLNFIVKLDGKDAFGRNSGRAIVQVPRSLPNMIELPAEVANNGREFVFMSSIIHYFMGDIFVGMTVQDCYQFRLTRNSDIFLDEEETDDLLRAMQGELVYRQYGDEVRLELTGTCPPDIENFLLERCEIHRRDLYKVNGPVNLNRLSDLFDLVKDSNLVFPPFVQSMPKLPKKADNYFDALKKSDILLHHPFDSFQAVVDFIREAATDPDVLAIKQTLYRTGSNSPVVDALVAAAKAGKEVTAIVELRARFDEEQNVALAERLQRYGIHVIYGVVGYKTHAKMLLVARREQKKLAYYVHLGTGNYHPKTAKLYTDYGVMTSDSNICADVYRIFLQLSSMGKASKMHELLYAPFTLHKAMLRHINQEIENANNGLPARIVVKMNSLYEEQLVLALYEASNAGVKVDLIVRGVCQLRPDIAGQSENIHVRSIVGRFLEHTRVFYFENAGDPAVYCSSADWMIRNMFHRVETCFPVKAKKLREQIISDLELYLADNTHAWVLHSDGHYEKLQPAEGEAAVDAQGTLLNQWASNS
ncbi:MULTISPECIES: polyphosphate kinase 1 [unclassified Gilvimarinus]|uniref:polyphosphate kinase 1 n=1 Tax=unclassified Gilvimarinus TaxID=2642066 RepID=UPI0026E461FD|nr:MULTISPECIES: polyphosphate kinase 1 [unclassified Gilvimarinus]MDO6570661.1 polyphosphate kinase 1 [Gilvimarinus sp. 2_MG-2023]MDO6746674.1 polyphosphate kinase 1 [Gilvimarinus sp. 1_MG-2023]